MLIISSGLAVTIKLVITCGKRYDELIFRIRGHCNEIFVSLNGFKHLGLDPVPPSPERTQIFWLLIMIFTLVDA